MRLDIKERKERGSEPGKERSVEEERGKSEIRESSEIDERNEGGHCREEKVVRGRGWGDEGQGERWKSRAAEVG